MNNEEHELKKMLDGLSRRDKEQVDAVNGFFGDGPTIENRINLANCRAMDALVAIGMIAKYIMQKEQESEAIRTKYQDQATSSGGKNPMSDPLVNCPCLTEGGEMP